MRIIAGEWLALEPVERYLEIHRAYVRTQKKITHVRQRELSRS